MTLLDHALACLDRGWYVFPCKPRKKEPLGRFAPNGFKNASNDRAQIIAWWTAVPDANIGIACGMSNLCVLDIDNGLADEIAAGFWQSRNGLPDTFMVRTGRRPEYGLQIYFSGSIPDVGLWRLDGCEGQVKSAGGYVMAEGSVHPSGETYAVVCDAPLAETPNGVRNLRTVALPVKAGPMGKIPDGAGRHAALTSVAGKLRSSGLDRDALYDALVPINVSMCEVPISDADLEHIADSVSRYAVPEVVPEVTIGGKLTVSVETTPAPADWRTLFHTKDDVVNCPLPTFLIDRFLAREAICAIAAPVAQRKSLIAINMARSLCTGAPLFDALEVHHRPSRVLYLCPEMGLVSLSERIRKIGLVDCLDETFFFRSMNLKNVGLCDIPDDALDGSVLIIDTAIRFIEGDENSSESMRNFSETLFRVQRKQGKDGAIVALYHSPKATKDASELTLENCLRGSGELGAAITDAHGTRLQDPADTHGSFSYVRHIKARDYKGLADFEVSSDADESGILRGVGDILDSERATLKVKIGGSKANRDGKDDQARAIVKAHVDLSVPQLITKLADYGIDRKKTWVTEARMDAKGSGTKLAETSSP